MKEQKMIPWDVVIEILNKFQANNPGITSERVNKYVNDEIYEWFYEQEPHETVDEVFTLPDSTRIGFDAGSPDGDYSAYVEIKDGIVQKMVVF